MKIQLVDNPPQMAITHDYTLSLLLYFLQKNKPTKLCMWQHDRNNNNIFILLLNKKKTEEKIYFLANKSKRWKKNAFSLTLSSFCVASLIFINYYGRFTIVATVKKVSQHVLGITTATIQNRFYNLRFRFCCCSIDRFNNFFFFILIF